MLGMLQTMVQPEAVIHALGPKIWIDPRYFSGGNGTLITTASDRSGNRNNFTQGTDIKKPVLVTTASSIPASMLFDGINDSMSTPLTVALSNTRKITFLCMHNCTAITANVAYESSTDSGNQTNAWYFGRSAFSAGQIAFGGGATTNYNLRYPPSSISQWVPFIGLYDRSAADSSNWYDTIRMYQTGTQMPSGSSPINGSAAGNFGNYSHYLGMRNNATSPFTGFISTVCLFDKRLTVSEIQALDSCVRDIHGRIA